MMIQIRIKYLFLLLMISGYAFIFSESLQQDIVRYPQVDIIKIRQIAKDMDFDPNSSIQKLNDMLNKFYLSDPGKKKIQQEQDVNFHLPYEFHVKKEWNVNIQRLFMKDLLSQPASDFFIKEAGNLFEAHYLLAQCYMKIKDPFHASYHFTTALRYRSLRMTPEIFTDENRLFLMAPDDPQVLAAKEYQDNLRNLKENQQQQRLLEEELIIYQDNLKAQKQSNVNLLEEQLKKNRELLAAQRQKNSRLIDKFRQSKDIYEQYKKEWNTESASFLVQTSDLVRQIEDSIKEKQKVMNHKVLYNSNYNQDLLHDYAQNRNYTAYANILEMAERLNPDDSEVPYRLGEEYRTAGKAGRAIFSYEKALVADSKQLKFDQSKKAQIYTSLGGLYYGTNRYVDSVKYYEQAYKLETIPSKKENLRFQLGKLHSEKTGNYPRAEELLLEHAKDLSAKNPSDIHDRTSWIDSRFRTWNWLSEMYEKTGKDKSWGKSLTEARNSFEDLDKMINEQRNLSHQYYKEWQLSKKPLFDDTKDQDLSNYYRLKTKYDAQKQLLAQMETVRRSLPLKNVYFGLARFYESKNSIREALEVFNRAEQLGIEPDEARRQADRIRKEYY